MALTFACSWIRRISKVMWSWRIRAMLLDWLPYWAATVSKLTVELKFDAHRNVAG